MSFTLYCSVFCTLCWSVFFTLCWSVFCTLCCRSVSLTPPLCISLFVFSPLSPYARCTSLFLPLSLCSLHLSVFSPLSPYARCTSLYRPTLAAHCTSLYCPLSRCTLHLAFLLFGAGLLQLPFSSLFQRQQLSLCCLLHLIGFVKRLAPYLARLPHPKFNIQTTQNEHENRS